jgi:hypothetical protein
VPAKAMSRSDEVQRMRPRGRFGQSGTCQHGGQQSVRRENVQDAHEAGTVSGVSPITRSAGIIEAATTTVLPTSDLTYQAETLSFQTDSLGPTAAHPVRGAA